LWMQWDYGDGPVIDGRKVVLFCAWLAWSRYRVVVPLWDKTMPSVVMGLDRAFRYFDGVPTYALTEYVARHIFVILCPTRLCGQFRHGPRDRRDRRGRWVGVGHIMIRVMRASSGVCRRFSTLGWFGMPSRDLGVRSSGALPAWLWC
jgi:hypothetical protein